MPARPTPHFIRLQQRFNPGRPDVWHHSGMDPIETISLLSAAISLVVLVLGIFLVVRPRAPSARSTGTMLIVLSCGLLLTGGVLILHRFGSPSAASAPLAVVALTVAGLGLVLATRNFVKYTRWGG
jgi:hypothetical protein